MLLLRSAGRALGREDLRFARAGLFRDHRGQVDFPALVTMMVNADMDLVRNFLR